jgi:hypothetical protein
MLWPAVQPLLLAISGWHRAWADHLRLAGFFGSRCDRGSGRRGHVNTTCRYEIMLCGSVVAAGLIAGVASCLLVVLALWAGAKSVASSHTGALNGAACQPKLCKCLLEGKDCPLRRVC